MLVEFTSSPHFDIKLDATKSLCVLSINGMMNLVISSQLLFVRSFLSFFVSLFFFFLSFLLSFCFNDICQ